jgi:tetratricopeptide (TPR) repeat protein
MKSTRHLSITKYITTIFLLLTISLNIYAQPEITTENVLEYSIKIAQELIETYPQSPQAYSALAYAYYRGKKIEDAIEAFKKSLQIKHDQPVIVQMVAFLYNRLTEYEKAVEWYQKTIALQPDAPRANERLGLALQKLNRMDEAILAFQNELKYHPDDASTHIYLGNLLFAANRLEEAEKHALLAKKYQSILPEPYYLLGKIYRKQGKKEETKKILQTFQQKKKSEQQFIEDEESGVSKLENPNTAAVKTHLEVGAVYYQMRNDAKADYHFKRVLSLDPKNATARYNLALMYQQSGKIDQAAQLYQELIAVQPDNPQFLTSLGLLRSMQKRYSDALPLFEKALSIAPEHINAKRAAGRLLLSTGKDVKRALQLLQSVVKHAGEASDYDLLGWAYFANGQHQKSLQSIQTAIDKDPKNPLYRKRYQQIRQRVNQ